MKCWFRLYPDAMRDPKVAALSDNDFRWWIKLLCIAAENDGIIPPVEQTRHLLSARLDHASKALDRMSSVGLIKVLDNGFTPNKWNEYQYKSDSSRDRVAKHRAKRNVTKPLHVTAPEAEAEKAYYVSQKNGDQARLQNEADAVPLDSPLSKIMKAARMTEIPSDRQIMTAWLAEGIDVDTTICTVAARIAERENSRGKPIRKLKYLDDAVREEHGSVMRERERLSEISRTYA